MGEGYIRITKDGDVEFKLEKLKWCATKYVNKDKIYIYDNKCSDIEIVNDATNPIIESINISKTSNSITIVVNAYDDESGISKYEYSIDGGNTWSDKKENNAYTFNNLTNDKEYEIKVKVYNGTYGKDNYDEMTGSTESEITKVTLDELPLPIITVTNEATYEKSKQVNIDYGNIEGITGSYSIDGGTTWKEENSLTVNKNNTNIIAKTTDGKNTITVTYTVTHIDEVSPTLILGEIITTDKTITIPITENKDDESGIKTTTCVYGETESYGKTGTIEENKCIINNLDMNKTYYYKITSTDNVGNITEQTGNSKTTLICPTPIITIENKANWTTSKNVTIDYGNVEGCTGKYSLDGSNFNEGINITVNENTFIYAINEGGETTTTSQEEITTIDNTNPSLNITEVSTTTKSIEITFSAEDEQSGIKSTTCTYGETNAYGKTGTIEGNICKINNLKNNTTYYYKITTENNAGLIEVQEGNTKTGEFSNISITPSSENYERSKTYTITGETNGVAIEYKVTNGSIVKQDWTSYTEPILVDYESSEDNKTVIYARLNDGINTSSEISIEETKIDISSPLNITLSSNSNSNYNKSLNVTVTLKDEHSGLQAGSIKYGWSTSTSVAPSSYTTVSTSATTGTNTTTFIANGSNLTGSYYLWVVPVNYKDKAGNSNTTTVKSTGTFNFDNTNPTNMTLSSNSDSTYSKTKSITVTLKDTGGSGLATGSVKYGWSTSTSAAPSSYTTVSTSSTTGTNATTFIASGSGLTGSYYLWVVPVTYKDKAGNSNTTTVKSTGTFKFDNTVPTLTLGTVTSTDKTITIPISTKSDSHSGIKSTTCVYGTSTSYGSTGTISSNKCIISGLNSSTTYYYKITTTDNAGNTVYKTGYKTTTASQPTYMSTTTVKNNPVYYDPVAGKRCTESQYKTDLANYKLTSGVATPTEYTSSTGQKTGCMKWYKYRDNNDGTITMVLDHNLTTTVTFSNNSISGSTMFNEINQQLKNLTQNWGITPRLITADEVALIASNASFKTSSSSKETCYSFYNHNSCTATTGSIYGWLVENTTTCKEYGCSNESDVTVWGYYTSSTVYGDTKSLWGVFHNAKLLDVSTTRVKNGTYTNPACGIRPVITISK